MQSIVSIFWVTFLVQWEAIKSLIFCRDVLPTTNVFPSFSPLKPWREGNRDKTAPFFPPPRFPPQPDSYFLLTPRLLFRPWKKLSRLCEFSFSHFPTRLFLDFRGGNNWKDQLNECLLQCFEENSSEACIFFLGRYLVAFFLVEPGQFLDNSLAAALSKKSLGEGKSSVTRQSLPPKKHRLPSVFPENRNTKMYRIFCQRRLQSFPWPFQEY